VGSCVLNAISFNDTTKSTYGAASKWTWNFGDETTTTDISTQQNPSWKYSTIGTKTVELIVESNKGCRDTVALSIEVKDKPLIALAFKDTLICSIDTLQLNASGLGNFSWQPNSRIINPNTPNPLVYPLVTTKYEVTLDEFGCVNKDTVTVRVVDFVTLNAGPDSTICLTDPVTLRPSGDGLYFTWTPAATLNNPNIKNPVARPVAATTTYNVTARIGKCNTTDDITIRTVPYPGSNAGPDTVICYRDTAQLNGAMIGSSVIWTPGTALSNRNILDPLAYPLRTTSYVMQVYDVLGCPKPGLDTVVVTVRPPVIAFAGNDTSVVVNQPLQLRATGAQNYLWTPPTNLNQNNIQSPVAVFSTSGVYTYIVRVSTPEDCFNVDTINIKVFQTAPDIFVPNAFTPDKTQNNLFRPIPVGISRIDFFRVYNRLGNLIFSGTDGSGWDGRYAGKKQDTGTYVWVVQGRDFTGKTIFKKGTMVLIR
ncbi:MAG: gliding motility-associated C-terminal domain-containing protein, partial [Gemmatimonadaceae bacterium]|nr:gliding motility-associated C-terminal domain-containing protein [Chitinophagaceae bacterium]